jgi:hypothetical protein
MQLNGKNNHSLGAWAVLPDGNGGFTPCPALLTEDELIRLLRIPEISKAQDFHNVIAHLKRHHGLPCIHVCRQPLYPFDAVVQWVMERMEREMVQ